MSETAGHHRLERALSPLEVMLLTLSALSPALSVFVGGNAVLHLAGTGAALGFILGGLIAALFALLFAELASGKAGAGGTYAGLNAFLGPRWTFPYVMVRLVIVFPMTAFISLGFGTFVHDLVPAISTNLGALLAIAAAAGVAVLQVKRGSQVIAVFLVIEALALAVLTWVALTHGVRSLGEVLANPVVLGKDGALAAVEPGMMALGVVSGASMASGANWATYFAENMDDARRRIGRVVAWAGLIAALTIAVPVVLVVLAIDNVPAVLAHPAPMAEFLRRSAGPTTATLVSIGVAAAVFNAVIAAIMGLSRQLFAIARDGVFPAWIGEPLARLHPRYRSPAWAVLALSLLGALCLLLGERRLLLIISGEFAEYFLISAAILLARRGTGPAAHFRAALHPLLPLGGIAMGVVILLANWNDAETARLSMLFLLGIFVTAFIWHEARIRQGRPAVVLKGSDIDD
ncbi:MAG TPA: APC family permease [Novosphingobium sp.]|nr:APC family permease [Novosphingobium sp.]